MIALCGIPVVNNIFSQDSFSYSCSLKEELGAMVEGVDGERVLLWVLLVLPENRCQHTRKEREGGPFNTKHQL